MTCGRSQVQVLYRPPLFKPEKHRKRLFSVLFLIFWRTLKKRIFRKNSWTTIWTTSYRKSVGNTTERMLSMATITPKEKDGKIIAYKFRTCVGRDENGRQVSRATTWKIPENLSMTRLTSAAQRAAADWEKQARAEYEKDLYDFARFVLEEWYPICIDNGERKPKTVSFYHDTAKNIVAHFQGQIVQKITAPVPV